MPITPQELILNLGDLPPLPQVAAQVLRLASDPDSTTDQLQRVVATDQALAAQTLKVANSAMFGMVREVRTLTQAIMTLGFTTIKSIVIASSARNLYKRGGTGLQERLLWEHALSTALGARAFARELRSPRAEEAFLGGLLHDIGKTVMGLKFPERYGALVRSVYNQATVDELDAELELFGFDHAMVGEALLASWNLARSLENAVRWHHHPELAPEEDRVLTAFVTLANQLAVERGAGLGQPQVLQPGIDQAAAILGLDPEALAECKRSVSVALDSEKNLIADF
jgi:putative nucleotidyltransferase with HDIG domain